MTHYHESVPEPHEHVVEEPVAVETHDDVVVAEPGVGTVIRRFVVLLFGILQGLLILRVVLLLLGANEGNALVAFVLGVTDPFVAPFVGMFDADTVSSGQSALDVAALVALIGWTLVEALVLAIVGLADRRRVVV